MPQRGAVRDAVDDGLPEDPLLARAQSRHPPDGVGVVETRTRLLVEHGIVTSAIGPERAPGEMTGPVLRISPHLDATADDLEALAAAL